MIVLEEIRASGGLLQCGVARLVAREAPAIAERCEFELDHLGAELGENPGAGRSCHELCDVEHAVTFEHRQSSHGITLQQTAMLGVTEPRTGLFRKARPRNLPPAFHGSSPHAP